MYNTCNNPIYLLHRYYYNHLLYRAKHPVKVHVWAGITRKVPFQSAYLMELWMQCYLYQSLTELYYHSWRAVFLINTVLCKAMIQNTHLEQLNNFLKIRWVWYRNRLGIFYIFFIITIINLLLKYNFTMKWKLVIISYLIICYYISVYKWFAVITTSRHFIQIDSNSPGFLQYSENCLMSLLSKTPVLHSVK